jgi:hypothetical protein
MERKKLWVPFMDASRFMGRKTKEVTKDNIIWVFKESELIKKRKNEWDYNDDVSPDTPFNDLTHYKQPKYKTGIFLENIWYNNVKERAI